MEDAATAEICRSQLWQWIHHPAALLSDGRKISGTLYRQFLTEEIQKIKTAYGSQAYSESKMDTAIELFDELATSKPFVQFLTLPAYEKLD